MPRNFDAIVIGSGLGGLTAAALFARAGHKVLVLERNESFGGAATVYRHGALAIEASLHEIDGLDVSDPKAPILRALGLSSDIPFVDVGDLHEVRSPLFDKPFVMPHGFEAALAACKAHFPEASGGIEQYFDRIHAVRQAVATMSEHQDDRSWWLWNAPTLPWRLWPLIRDRHGTVSEVFGRLFGDNEAVKLAVASNLGYYTDNPDTMPFIHFAVPQASYLAGGGHYIRGGSQVLSDRLVAIIREAGGEVEAGREVETILLDGNRASGVRHRGRKTGDVGEELAPIVFGNAAPTVLATMLPEDRRANFLLRYQGRRPSISLWTMSLGLKRHSHDFGVAHYSTSVLPAWLTTLSGFRDAAAILGEESENRITPYGFVAYDQIDSGLNFDGPYLAAVVGLDRVQNWAGLTPEAKRARKDRWMDRIIADLDRQFPGIAATIVHREMSTSETFQQYLNTPGGSLYGFAPESRGFMPSAVTAIDGLYLASAFTGGGGFTGAILGGGWAARAATRVDTST
ncbi:MULTISPECIES: NAD(P)/FAD-dependent oxidoreductase [unclassified Bradyrhizobium]|uniref:phytoene desaturase family protein n=1 Tax=unclassified Bradyrhizobium TaxID=2631580 RepID=UPI001BAAE2A7|nr:MULTISPECIES: NAD(P)/FAD-dependent oxidoreductase [unclassified Bradyrhizobium]MBR1205167.1 NAD(P)/FAD-dependent oxidoreductase [Bradyrhizobium sp. AUGA SZCCT0124]MBR1312246.1 NAD(P)/FAD-dependent oxidoreductase [Bradyrhizobium sp. AUGA SZCCT0051]MBR1342137.1 NAD(P)/FAD-dependent oxidoreductase [Bradyrhizobium sp. AUGA SZCCT0105]MBR1358928.1 NAD(P)/FAD-dependent oxidoreductase [Bradyrhizobium sp. AUGA SZCCT0045]